MLLAMSYLLSKYLLRWIFEKISKTPEMVVAMSIAWCAFMTGIGELKNRNIKGIFGDISSMDTMEQAHIVNSNLILSTIPDMLLKGTNNRSIVTICHAVAPNAIIVATADSVDQIEPLKASGANEVLLPYTLIGDHLARFVRETCRDMEN